VQDIDARIQRMYRRDQFIAVALVAVLIATLTTVYVATSESTETRGVGVVLALAGGALVLFNGASIWAMLRHNRKDRTYIYSLDIKHLDEYRAKRAIRNSQTETPP
jgi:hypothetical protein